MSPIPNNAGFFAVERWGGPQRARSIIMFRIRHEGVILARSRRGREPHIVTVTAEPLPSRLAAIACGTGEVDAVYHVALAKLTRCDGSGR